MVPLDDEDELEDAEKDEPSESLFSALLDPEDQEDDDE